MPIVDISHVLCPVDLSDSSRNALKHAIALADWYAAHVSVLYVFELLTPPRFLSLNPGAMSPPYPAREDVIADVTRFIEPLQNPRVSTEILVEEGTAARTIVETARTRGAGLIVIGTHGRGGVEHLMLGSVTEKVLRQAPCPVLVIPPHASSTTPVARVKRVLCPVDFADSSSGAVRMAAALVEEAEGQLTILHVIEWSPDESAWLPKGEDVRALWERGARRELDALISADDRTWCTVASRIDYGKPYRRILEVAKEEHSDLIVMGVSGRGAIDRAFFGSTVNHVVRQAPCPILIVR